MIQKPILIRSLMLGISLSILGYVSSCKPVEEGYIITGTFIYVNQTDSVIKVDGGMYPLQIEAHRSDTITTQWESSEKDIVRSYNIPYSQGQIVYYGHLKCDTLNLPNEGILNLGSYASERLGDRRFRLTYTFTNVDYNKAVTCK